MTLNVTFSKVYTLLQCPANSTTTKGVEEIDLRKDDQGCFTINFLALDADQN